MSRWGDIAVWRGPTVNQGGPMVEQRGLVVHIAQGYFEGTIAWQRNPDANVSSHFIVAKDGRIAQMVDTDVTAWTQRAGNGYWLSVENEGFTPSVLTAAQVDANARILAKAHQVYRVPLQLATDPNGRGLGHHSMGCNWPAGEWGHCDCPGPNIINQKPAILARAQEIVTGGTDMTPEEWLNTPIAGTPDFPGRTVRQWGGDLFQGVHVRLTAFEAEVRDALAELKARPPIDLTDTQLEQLAEKVATRLAPLIPTPAAVVDEEARRLAQ